MEHDQEIILKLLRKERNSVAIHIDTCTMVWGHPDYRRLPWFNYDDSLKDQRVYLSQLNALIARYL